jgi:hypothetical protein
MESPTGKMQREPSTTMRTPPIPPQTLESNSGPRPLASVPIGNPSFPVNSPTTAQPPSPALGQQPQGPLPQQQGPLPPPAVSPDQILDHAPRKARVIRLDANVVAYFGDMLLGLRSAIAPAPPRKKG